MQISQELLKEFKKNIGKWKESKENIDIADVYKADRKALMEVYNLLEEGDVKTAAIVARNLDTIVRDQIPNKVYDILAQNR